MCTAVAISERSLRRTFRAETGTSWREYRTTSRVLPSRVLRAMTMLADRSILDTATAVGFESLSGVDRAFRRLIGERPVDYRRRVRDAAVRDAPEVAPTVR